MNVWEFRRKVRENRWLLLSHCPLGAALASQAMSERKPGPTTAWRKLGLHWGYVLGVVGGFDASTPDTELPDSDIFEQGERYGRRMRLVAKKLRGGAP